INEQALTEAHQRHDPEGMLKALEKKLAQSPDDAEGWFTLGRAYVEMKRMDEALKALDRARQLDSQNASYLAQYAEALAMAQGNLLGEPLQLIQAALEINYEEEKALELAGLAAFQQEKWAESLHYWRRLLKRLPKDSEMYEAISRAVGVAEQKVEAAGLGDRAKLQPPPMAKQPH
ncbi:MAG: c-type cytochrome biosis protein CcmI, partial [Pseudomonadota bacterium]